MNLSEYKKAKMKKSTYDNIVKGSGDIVDILKKMKSETNDREYQWWLEDYMQEIILKVKFLKPSDMTHTSHVKNKSDKNSTK